MAQQYFTYITSNPNRTTLYIGMTNDITARLWEHQQASNGLKQSFAGKYHCYKLIYIEVFDTPSEALRREKQLKGWTRKKKLQLIKEINPRLKALNEDVVLLYPSDRINRLIG